jgi:flagellar FliJ protein
MKRFRFTLQALLNVKTTLEKQKIGELAAQNQIIARLEDQLAEMYARLDAAVTEYNDKMAAGGMSPGDTAAYGSGFRAMYDRIREQHEKIARAQEVKEQIQRELTELMGERKMLENLREKQYQEYIEEVRREDAKVLDDFMSSKEARN